MRTNFFQAIARMHSAGAWTFNISFTAENEMLVSVLLKDNGKLGDKYPLPPMVYRGSPQELDEGILASLCEPVEQTKSLFISAEQYEKGLAEAKAKMAQKPKGDKVATKEKTEQAGEEPKPDRPKFEDILAEVNRLNAGCKYADALALLPSGEDYPEKKNDIEKLRKDLEWKNRQLTLL